MNDHKYDNVVMIAKLACVWQLVEVPNGVSPLGRDLATDEIRRMQARTLRALTCFRRGPSALGDAPRCGHTCSWRPTFCRVDK